VVTAASGLWARAAPRLEELREPFGPYAERPGGWMAAFDDFARLVREWGEVVVEAQRRGWGVVGLWC